MGQKASTNAIGYEAVQQYQKRTDAIIINTMAAEKQSCLIAGTLPAHNEEIRINDLLRQNKSIAILVYGENSCDQSSSRKQSQLRSLGFTNVSEYRGGLFEWLLLQEVYGESNFPTTATQIDILKYGPQHDQTLALTQF